MCISGCIGPLLAKRAFRVFERLERRSIREGATEGFGYQDLGGNQVDEYTSGRTCIDDPMFINIGSKMPFWRKIMSRLPKLSKKLTEDLRSTGVDQVPSYSVFMYTFSNNLWYRGANIPRNRVGISPCATTFLHLTVTRPRCGVADLMPLDKLRTGNSSMNICPNGCDWVRKRFSRIFGPINLYGLGEGSYQARLNVYLCPVRTHSTGLYAP